MDEHASYNQGFNGPLHMAHNDPNRRPHTMQVRYPPYDGNYRGPFDHNSPFSYFPLFPEPPTSDGIFRNHPGKPSDNQFTEEEVDKEYLRRENMSILNSDVDGAYTTLELI